MLAIVTLGGVFVPFCFFLSNRRGWARFCGRSHALKECLNASAKNDATEPARERNEVRACLNSEKEI